MQVICLGSGTNRVSVTGTFVDIETGFPKEKVGNFVSDIAFRSEHVRIACTDTYAVNVLINALIEARDKTL